MINTIKEIKDKVTVLEVKLYQKSELNGFVCNGIKISNIILKIKNQLKDLKEIYEIQFNFTTKPSDILKEYMDSRNLKKEEVAKVTNHSETYINIILKGLNKITPNFAYKLEKVFPDVKAEFWLQLEYNHDIFLLKELRKDVNKDE